MLAQLAACAVCFTIDPRPVIVHPADDPNHGRVICWRCFDHLTGREHVHPEWCPTCSQPLTLF